MVYRYVISTRPARPCPWCVPGAKFLAHCKNNDPKNKDEYNPLRVRFCPECGRRIKEKKA